MQYQRKAWGKRHSMHRQRVATFEPLMTCWSAAGSPLPTHLQTSVRLHAKKRVKTTSSRCTSSTSSMTKNNSMFLPSTYRCKVLSLHYIIHQLYYSIHQLYYTIHQLYYIIHQLYYIIHDLLQSHECACGHFTSWSAQSVTCITVEKTLLFTSPVTAWKISMKLRN